MIEPFSLMGALIYAPVHVFTAQEVMTVLRWGIVTVILEQLSSFLRGFLGARFEVNRVLRELKPLELRLVRLESDLR